MAPSAVPEIWTELTFHAIAWRAPEIDGRPRWARGRFNVASTTSRWAGLASDPAAGQCAPALRTPVR